MVAHLRGIGAVVHLTTGSAGEMATAASWGRHGAARICDEFSDCLQFLGHASRYAYFMRASQDLGQMTALGDGETFQRAGCHRPTLSAAAIREKSRTVRRWPGADSIAFLNEGSHRVTTKVWIRCRA
jgi:hypothetical protein